MLIERFDRIYLAPVFLQRRDQILQRRPPVGFIRVEDAAEFTGIAVKTVEGLTSQNETAAETIVEG
ncbi:hypothetical protein D3C87_1471050 [compost metagenome]